MNKIAFFNNRLLALIFSIFLVVIFHKRLESLISETIVKHLFSFVESTIINDIVIIITLLILTVATISKIKKHYIVHVNVLITWGILSIIYIWYRFSGHIWSFTEFYCCEDLKYLDIFLTPGVMLCILYITNRVTTSKDVFESKFIEDQPLNNTKTDLLSYERYCKEIAKKINESQFTRSFAVGVTGEWGTGKTSFMYLIKKSLNHQKQIIFDFNPWSSQSAGGITLDFFNTLSKSLAVYHSNISNSLLEYANNLIIGANNNLISSLKVFRKDGALADQYETINETLKKVNKQVIVFIDDLDRLDQLEAQEVLKLIRNTANFFNVVFIVAYDRNYLIQSIKKLNDHNPEFFLEKIFQIEINLPAFESKIIRKQLIETLATKLDADLKSEIEEAVNGSPFYKNHHLDDFISTLRDVNRLSNSLIINYNLLKDEVIFSELFLLEQLKIKFPSVYELLYRKENEFLETKPEGLKKYAYQLKSVNGKIVLESYLENNPKQVSFNKAFIPKILTLINTLFPSTQLFNISSKHLSIRYPSNYYKYFAFRLLEGNLSEVEFTKARKSTQEGFNRFISKTVKKGYGWNLRDRFEDIKSFDDREDFEKVINGIFHLARQSSEANFEFKEYIEYSGEDLYDKLYNGENTLAKKFYNGSNESLKEFVLSNFKDATYPYLVESSMIKDLTNRTFIENFVLSINELEALNVRYLEAFLEQESQFTHKVWWQYNNCHFKRYHHNNGTYRSEIYIIPKAKELVIKFIKERDVKGFLETIIDYDMRSGEHLAIYNGVQGLFDTWDGFYEFLESLEERDYVREFKQFFLAFKETAYQQKIKYPFVHFKSRRE